MAGSGAAPGRIKDNVHPYNWHWFRIWGTGETLNNGTHEVDVCRWALGVDYPKRITSSGGRYHFKDDWQFYDTLVTSFEYDDKMISWEGKSCQGMKFYGPRPRLGDHGNRRHGARRSRRLRDLRFEREEDQANSRPAAQTSSADLLGRDSMTDAHFANFIAGIRKGEKLNAPIAVGNVAVTMLQLSNVAWEVKRDLHLDPKDGHIQNDPEAMKLWGREYEKGWEPRCLTKNAILATRFCFRSRRGGCCCVSCFPAPLWRRTQMQPSGAKPSPIRLGLASYTFRNFTRAQLIGFMKQLNVFDLNAKDVKDHLPMDPEDEARALADYAAAGIKLHAAGAIYFPKDEDADIRVKVRVLQTRRHWRDCGRRTRAGNSAANREIREGI